MLKKIKLHHIFFLGFTLISAVPAVFLATWVQRSALDKEVAAVAEKHLLLAQNLTIALDRYVTDVDAAFGMAAGQLERGQAGKDLTKMLGTLRIRKVCIIDERRRILLETGSPSGGTAKTFPAPVFKFLAAARELAVAAPGKVVFSDVTLNERGLPTIFLVTALKNRRFAVAPLATDYLVELQQTIAFGKKGHAAIVDRTGRVLAHPNPRWRAELKDLSAVKAVGQMKRGNTGVIKFFSPATNSDMIAGYTVLPRVGWGVMIPQPYEELVEKAGDVQRAALAVTLFGFAFAGLLGWLLARYLAGPIQAVAASAREMAAGRLTARAPEFTHVVPHELRELLNAFNRMVDEVGANNAKLEETADRLRNAQRIAGLGNWEWNLEKNTLSYSQELLAMFGNFPDEFDNTFEAFQKTIHPDDRERVAGAFSRALYEREPFDVVHRLVFPDGRERIVHQRAEVHYDESGKPLRMSGTAHDITERERAERLRASEEYFKSLVGQAAEAFFLHDEEGKILDVNQRACDSLGYTREELVEMKVQDFISDVDAETFSQVVATVTAEEPLTHMGSHTRKDGSTFPVEVQIGPIDSGGERRMLALARDVTERVRLEERLRQSQKLEAMGILAGGIAHDFNNILSPILGFSELVLEKMPEGSQERADLQVVIDAATRAKDIVSQVLIFSRKSEGHFEEFDLRSQLTETAKFLRSTLPKDIMIAERFSAEPAVVRGDATQINQVLINLTVNARQAMPEGGVLNLALDNLELKDFDCLLGERISGPYVKISVSDSGAGIDEKVLEHIFEPFFTTKPIGRGTGLGLSTVLGIVKYHEGALRVVTAEGKGTTFEVYLKRHEGVPPATVTATLPSPAGSENILLVDDEAAIARLGTRVLQEFGYRVTAFTSPLEALENFRANPSKYQLVITDQMMDGITGEKLAAEMRRIRQDIPIVLCTGFSESVTPEMTRKLGLNGFYYKPISAESLGGIVRRALDESSGTIN